MALCMHVATVGADERGAEAGEHQRLPALPDGRAAGGLADVLSFLGGQIGFSLQGMICSHALSVKRVGPPEPCTSLGGICRGGTRGSPSADLPAPPPRTFNLRRPRRWGITDQPDSPAMTHSWRVASLRAFRLGWKRQFTRCCW